MEGVLRNLTKLAVIILVSGCLFSCGYQMIREKGLFGGEMTSIHLDIFKNATFEANLSQCVTDAFSRELLSAALFTMNSDNADGQLRGTIIKITTQPTALTLSDVSKTSSLAEKTVSLEVELALYKKDGTFVKRWKFSESETYRVDDIALEDYNKKDAIKRLSARMARRFSSALLVDYEK